MKSVNLLIFNLLLIIHLSSSIEVTCEYRDVPWGAHFATNIYECNIQDKLVIKDRSQVIANVSGEHSFLNANEDVTGVHMKDKTINYFPSGFGKFFIKLLGLSMENCNLKELTQENLKEFPKLKHIWIFKNFIEILDKSLFKYNPDLIYINFNSNKIKEIDRRLFDNLKTLKTVEMRNNICINMKTSKDTTLSALITKVKDSCSIKNERNETESEEEPETTEATTITTTKKTFTTQRPENEVTTKKTNFIDKLKNREKLMKQREMEENNKTSSSLWTKAALGGASSLIVVTIITILAMKVIRKSRSISDVPK